MIITTSAYKNVANGTQSYTIRDENYSISFTFSQKQLSNSDVGRELVSY